MKWLLALDVARRAFRGRHRAGVIGDDVRDLFRSEHPPSWHRARLDRMVRSEWRILFVIVGILLLGSLAELVT